MGNTQESNQQFPVYDEDEMRSELIHEDASDRTVTYICDCFASKKENRNLSLHRAMNLRAGMSTNHIKDLKKELSGMDLAAADIDQSQEIESNDTSNNNNDNIDEQKA